MADQTTRSTSWKTTSHHVSPATVTRVTWIVLLARLFEYRSWMSRAKWVWKSTLPKILGLAPACMAGSSEIPLSLTSKEPLVPQSRPVVGVVHRLLSDRESRPVILQRFVRCCALTSRIAWRGFWWCPSQTFSYDCTACLSLFRVPISKTSPDLAYCLNGVPPNVPWSAAQFCSATDRPWDFQKYLAEQAIFDMKLRWHRSADWCKILYT